MLLICDNCKNPVEGIQYNEGSWGVVEEHYDCTYCGFRRHWAYGRCMPEDSEFAETEVSDKDVIEHMEENNIPKDIQLLILSRKSKKIEYIKTKMLDF